MGTSSTLLCIAGFFSACDAVADIAVYRGDTDPPTLRHLLRVSGHKPLLVRKATQSSTGQSVTSAAGRRSVIELTPHYELSLSGESDRDATVIWSPPRQLLLDRARSTIDASEHATFVQAFGLSGSGRGVAIGIIDSGVDLEHADLRHAAGKTRVAWLIEFGADPFGFYPDLERTYGCGEPQIRCGILGEAEINRLLEGSLDTPGGEKLRVPRDVLGHGTHVASLAAGNGGKAGKYVGVAPEATLIIAQVAQSSTSVSDADVVLATKFVFERAHELEMPSVVNLSLGGDFGPHDGSSAIGGALSEFLDEPGRAIVVAAGNSGGLIAAEHSRFPGPHGIHTDVHVPAGTSVRVPLLMPPGQGVLDGVVFVWVASQRGDRLRIGVEEADGTEVLPPLGQGQTRTVSNGETEVSVLNGSTDELGVEASGAQPGAAVILDGALEAGSSWVLRLEGHGSASLWLQAAGGVGPDASSGVVFPRATRAQTINIPADSPELIAVGASLNRTTWPTRNGGQSALAAFDEDLEHRSDSVAFFSSAGPSSLGFLKPDLVAPGGVIVGAMSDAADPERSLSSIFAFSPLCAELGCAVVDETHAATLGTSMAAPIVAGAVALLFEQEPTLTQEQVKALLQSGADPLRLASPGAKPKTLNATQTQLGAGRLNLRRSAEALRVLQGEHDAKEPQPEHSRLSLSDDFARPGGGFVLSGLLQLRDEDGNVAHVKSSELVLSVRRGDVVRPLASSAPGVYTFRVAADSDSGGEQLQVRVLFKEQVLAEQRLAIEVDSGVFAGGVELVSGCTLNPHGTSDTRPIWLWWLWFALTACVRLHGQRGDFTSLHFRKVKRVVVALPRFVIRIIGMR